MGGNAAQRPCVAAAGTRPRNGFDHLQTSPGGGGASLNESGPPAANGSVDSTASGQAEGCADAQANGKASAQVNGKANGVAKRRGDASRPEAKRKRQKVAPKAPSAEFGFGQPDEGPHEPVNCLNVQTFQ